MKKTMILLVTAMIMAFAAQAQDCNAHGKHPGRGHNMDPKKMVEMRVSHLDKELNLTADQKEAITEIYMQEAKEIKEKMDARMSEGKTGKPDKADRKARHEQMMKRQQEVDAKVESLLTADQKTRFAQLKQDKPNGRGMHKMMRGDKHGKGGDCCDKGDSKRGNSCGSCDNDKKAEAIK